ncbi:MAG TPA: EAL domain-containing protein [Noviherbaspirillum sp.]|uniref:putative bifunctional diguanylate cyclase/phosphodiesterase n=1 Tax=Noviherbaspirillum sp. TaxID=1926288 RepID=UPI002D653EB2|nr:EAL domain-containing protein [Noviherbaspirillum sp.]HYD95330.1 EAL domain-containing protein [Noviherbaspirillum sp.]
MTANTVLIVTDDTADAKLLRETLATARDGPFAIEWSRTLAHALSRLQCGGIDIVLLDPCLPDSQGLGAFDTLFKLMPSMPIMTLCDEDGEDFAVEAVQRGAQGFLSKGYFQNALVPQALRNVIQRKRVEEALFVERERARVTLESIGDAVLSTDVACNITYLNREAERMTGWRREEASGRPVAEVLQLIDGATRQPARDPLQLVIKHEKSLALHAMSVLRRRDGSEAPIEDSAAPIFDRNGVVTGAVVTFRDVSEARAMAQKMEHLAQHDCLTGLPNRILLHDRLEQAMAYAKRNGARVAMLFLDLDNFKHINDSLGHTVGDKLLQSVASRLTAQVRHSDTVSRQGGDEFVVLVMEDAHDERAAVLAEKILRSLAEPHHAGGNELHVTTSIGISLFPSDGANVETLLKNADTAMYHAKKKGRNNYQFFDGEMNARAVERQSTEAELRRAIDRGEFVVHYQPKVDLLTGNFTGAEALVRWVHPRRGIVFPDSFIPVAEDSGLIVPIGRMVLRQACAQAKAWLDQGMPPMAVAVNVSGIEFRSKRFFENVHEVLQETGLEARFLQLELTETVLMRNIESSSALLYRLKEMGVQLAVDDFGTDYSSLSYLTRFPIDVLKIDQSFVQMISAGSGNSIIVGAVIGMGANLGQRVIAEGVETQEQLRFLHAHHCDEGQGYLFGRPVPAADFGALARTLSGGAGTLVQ